MTRPAVPLLYPACLGEPLCTPPDGEVQPDGRQYQDKGGHDLSCPHATLTAPAKPASSVDCTCVFSCADDPAAACSLSGEFHVHPDSGSGTFGPCPVHPDAPGDL